VPSPMTRIASSSVSLTIASGAALSDAFDFSLYAIAIVHMPATWTAASIGFQICQTPGGTFLPLYDKDLNLVQIAGPSASGAYACPAELAGARWVKVWSQNGSGTGTNQAAARTVNLDLKS